MIFITRFLYQLPIISVSQCRFRENLDVYQRESRQSSEHWRDLVIFLVLDTLGICVTRGSSRES